MSRNSLGRSLEPVLAERLMNCGLLNGSAQLRWLDTLLAAGGGGPPRPAQRQLPELSDNVDPS